MKRIVVLILLFVAVLCNCRLSSCRNRVSERSCGQFNLVHQTDGPTLGYSKESGVGLLEIDGFIFKDLNRNGRLDRYEDWRKESGERAEDLADRMTIDQIAGLMLYSSHVAVNDAVPTEKLLSMVKDDNIRHILVTKVKNARTAAQWHNNLQAIVESLPLAVPTNNSSDPRNYTAADGEFNAGSGGDISHWPREIGLAATFDMDIIRRHGEIASAEYRALGITTTLSPQVDLSTDPRWRRFYGSFSEDSELCRDIVKTYTDAFQTTEGSKTGWGVKSVNCMAKHWPGGGTGEGGRDAHYCFGQYAVYPGNNFEEHLKPFLEGAFNLDGKTGMCSAVMPYYTVSFGQDPSGKNVANAYSTYIIRDLLRGKYGYDGVVCTDWGVTGNNDQVYKMNGKPWGVAEYSVAERHFLALYAGCDQFGGNNAKEPVIEAYKIWCDRYGKESADRRFRESAVRLLNNFFRVGVFENPYVIPEETEKVVGCKEFVEEGYDAQLKSVVMIKNHDSVLPIAKGSKVFMPERLYPASIPFFGRFYKKSQDRWKYPIALDLLEKYYTVTNDPREADFALVQIMSPEGNFGYLERDAATGGNGYVPISLQYSRYTAEHARKQSIAGGDPKENFTNRSYRGKTERSYNASDLKLVNDTKRIMGDKPVVVLVRADRPFVPEFEPSSDAVLIGLGVSNQAYLDIVCGQAEPYGLLPLQLPKDMKTVEEQFEDVPRDMECYKDSDGNVYDFAFGLNWSGVINDWRVEKYK